MSPGVTGDADRVLANARAAGDELLAQARRTADMILAEARAQAERERAESRIAASTEAEAVLDQARRQAQDQADEGARLREQALAVQPVAPAPDPEHGRRLAELQRRSAGLAAELNALDQDLAALVAATSPGAGANVAEVMPEGTRPEATILGGMGLRSTGFGAADVAATALEETPTEVTALEPAELAPPAHPSSVPEATAFPAGATSALEASVLEATEVEAGEASVLEPSMWDETVIDSALAGDEVPGATVTDHDPDAWVQVAEPATAGPDAGGGRDGRGKPPRVRGRWGRFVYRARYAVLAVAGLLVVVAGVFGPAVVASLSSGGFDVPGSESDRAAKQIAASVGSPQIDVVALFRSRTLTVDSPQFKAAVQAVYDRVPAAGVRSRSTFWTTNSPVFVSNDRHATYLAIQLSGTQSQNQDLFPTLRDTLKIDPAVGTTQFGGVTAVDVQISKQVNDDLSRAETISGFFLAVLLVIVFASVVAAGLPLMIGGITVLVSFLVLRALTHFTEISVFAINIVTVLGLGLAIDYALLIVSRFREELRAGHDTSEALGRTMTTAGRSVAISAVTVAASLSGLLFFPMVFLRSMAYGGVAAVLIAAAGSLTVLPAVIGVLGPRVNAWRIPLPGRERRARAAELAATEAWIWAGSESTDPADPQAAGAPGTAAGAGAMNVVARRPGRWERLAHSVMRRPVLYALGVSVLLLSLAVPTLQVKFGGIDVRQLPVGAQSRVVTEALAKDFTGVQLNPIQVLVRGGGTAAATQLSTIIATVPNVRGVRVGGVSGSDTLLVVDYPGEAIDPAARGVASAIRALSPPAGSTVLVGGFSAEQTDTRTAVLAGLWKMALLTFGVTFLLLFWAFGSVLLPIKAIIMNALAVGASLGIVVLVFQDGYGSGLLQFQSTGNVELTQPILVLAILFGVSTDYEVFLLSRIREQWDRTRDNTAAVATGLQFTGPIITSAAALILVVIVSFSTSQIIFIKLIGVGMAAAIFLDATVVRALLVPATMRLLGRWNWWAPGPLLRLWERHRPPAEDLTDELDALLREPSHAVRTELQVVEAGGA